MVLCKGARCEIAGLVGAAQYNSMHGTLVQFMPDVGRWNVLLVGGKVLAVKPENLNDLSVKMPDGMGLLAVETFNCKVRLIDVKTGEERITVRAQGKALGACLKFSHDGKMVACGGILHRDHGHSQRGAKEGDRGPAGVTVRNSDRRCRVVTMRQEAGGRGARR
ncbi:hypothetical protein T484DRAFT_1926245 [Baffinella frigidus]|nr:hypothetical protein T484DRAFT_1926245 [Cryptophyta sp. CCMP2293]